MISSDYCLGDGFVYVQGGRIEGEVRMVIRNSEYIDDCIKESYTYSDSNAGEDIMISYDYDDDACFLIAPDDKENPDLYHTPYTISRGKYAS